MNRRVSERSGTLGNRDVRHTFSGGLHRSVTQFSKTRAPHLEFGGPIAALGALNVGFEYVGPTREVPRRSMPLIYKARCLLAWILQ
jgi:hypothetical protein